MRSKLSFVINEYSFFKSHRLCLAQSLSKHYYVQIITDLSGVDVKELDEISNENLEFLHLRKRKASLNPVKFFQFVFKLNSTLKNHAPKYIFFVSLENCFIGSFISKFLLSKNNFFLITGLQTIISPESIKGHLRKKIYKAAFSKLDNQNRSNTFIFQNKFDQTDFLEFLPNIEHALIEGNGIDLNQFNYIDRFNDNNDENMKFLFASKLLKDKGLEEFLDASLYIKSKYSNCSFNIAGQFDPSNNQSISKNSFEMISEHPDLNYHGYIPNSDMNQLLEKHHILVLPSYREGLPAAVIEAAATGMPLIVTNVPGCSSLVEDNKNGYLIKPRSSSSIIEAMEKILKNKARLREFGKYSNHMIMKRFSIEKIAQEYLDLINQC
jgi:glycosyltransferase involved in cell wall biosynthesis